MIGTNAQNIPTRLVWSSVRSLPPLSILAAPGTRTISPNATITASGSPGLPTVRLAGNGWRAEYFRNHDFTGVVQERIDPAIDFDWMRGPPIPDAPSDLFSVRWTGYVAPGRSGLYQFFLTVDSDAKTQLWMDDTLLLWNAVNGAGSATLQFGRTYQLTLEYVEGSLNATCSLRWITPAGILETVNTSVVWADPREVITPSATASITPSLTITPSSTSSIVRNGFVGDGWRAYYYRNADFTDLYAQRIDAAISFNWGTGEPLPGLGADTFSVRWIGYITPPQSGWCYFSVSANEYAALYVDGRERYNNEWVWLDASEVYSVQLDYREGSLEAYCYLYWSYGGDIPTALVWSDIRQVSTRSVTPSSWPSSTTSPTMSPSASLNRPSGDGWRAQYYGSPDFTSQAVERIDSTINFFWGRAAPISYLTGVDKFSVRWVGFVMPTATDNYTFIVLADDVAQLWVDGAVSSSSMLNNTIQLIAGQAYSLRLEYREGDLNAYCRLLWSSSTMAPQVVPRALVWSDIRQVTTPSRTASSTYSNTLTATPTTSVSILSTGDGWKGEYFRLRSFFDPLVTRIDATINFDWGRDEPVPGLGVDNFAVRWSGFVRPPFSGNYTFTVLADEQAKLWVDGVQVVDTRFRSTGIIELAGGSHYSITVDYLEADLGARCSVSWQCGAFLPTQLINTAYVWSDARQLPTPAGTPSRTATGTITPTPTSSVQITPSGNGWLGQYYDQRQFTALKYTRVDPVISFNWGRSEPFPGMGNDIFSVRWTGFIRPPYSGNYSFDLVADDEAKLYIEDVLVEASLDGFNSSIELAGGTHYSIRVELLEGNFEAACRLYWTGPFIPRQILPSSFVWWDVRHLPSPLGTPSFTRTASVTATPTPSIQTYSSGLGWRAQYYANYDFTGLFSDQVDSAIDFNWGAYEALPGMGTDTFSIRWTGYLMPQYSEVFTFRLRADDDAQLYVDGALVADSRNLGGGQIFLNASEAYFLQVDYREGGPTFDPGDYYGAGGTTTYCRLFWSSASIRYTIVPQAVVWPDVRLIDTSFNYTAGNSMTPTSAVTKTPTASRVPLLTSGDGWKAAYYNDARFTDLQALRVDPVIDFNWTSAAPMSWMSRDTFSVRWEAYLLAPLSTPFTWYLDCQADDDARVWVDSYLVAQCGFPGIILLVEGEVYSLRVEYMEAANDAWARLSWSYGGVTQQVVPQRLVWSDIRQLRGSQSQTPSLSGTPTSSLQPGASRSGTPPLSRTGSATPPATASSTGSLTAVQTATATASFTGSKTVGTSPSQTTSSSSTGSATPTASTASGSTSQTPPVSVSSAPSASVGSSRSPSTTSSATASPPLAAGNGWLGQYFSNVGFTGLFSSRNDASISFNWGLGEPLLGMGADTFSVIWRAWLRPNVTGAYTFLLTADDEAYLSIDDVPVSWPSRNGTATLIAGQLYVFKVEFWEGSNNAHCQLQWRTPSGQLQSVPTALLWSDVSLVPSASTTPSASMTLTSTASSTSSVALLPSGDGWFGRYYRTYTFFGLVMQRVDPAINFNWNASAPAVGLVDTWSVIWTAVLRPLLSEDYTFYVFADETAQVFVNGSLVSWTSYNGSVLLGGGLQYDVMVTYRESSGAAFCRVYWKGVSTPFQLIPTELLWSDRRQLSSASITPSITSTPSLSASSTPSVALLPVGDGWLGQYYRQSDMSDLFAQRIDSAINFTWGLGEPLPGMGGDAMLRPPLSETYTFIVQADDDAQLWIDRTLVSWSTFNGSIALSGGQAYSVQVDFHEGSGDALCRVYWSSARIPLQSIPTDYLWSDARQLITPTITPTLTVTPTLSASVTPSITLLPVGNGRLGRYFRQIDLSDLLAERVDPVINFTWGTDEPLAGLSFDTFSVQWTGTLRPPFSGVFTFALQADDDAQLYVNGALVSWSTFNGSIALSGGQAYSMQVDFHEGSGNAACQLYWSASGIFQLVPSDVIWSDARQLPTPTVTMSKTPSGTQTPTPSPSVVILPSGNGLVGEYFDTSEFTWPIATRIDPMVNFNWGSAAPIGNPFDNITMGADTFSVRWKGYLVSRLEEAFTFFLDAPQSDDASLFLNDALVSTSRGPMNGTVQLNSGGIYSVRVELSAGEGNAWCRLFWSSPRTPLSIVPPQLVWTDRRQIASFTSTPPPTGTATTTPTPTATLARLPDGNGWLGRYYRTSDFTNLAGERIDPSINFTWGLGEPLPGMGADTFSVRWTGYLVPRMGGTYRFTLSADDDAWLYVDNALVSASRGNMAGTVQLRGWTNYSVRVDYVDADGYAYWQSDSLPYQIVPAGLVWSDWRLVPSPTATPSWSGSTTATASLSSSGSATSSASSTQTASPTSTSSQTPSSTNTVSQTPTSTASRTGTPSPSPTKTASATLTPTRTPSGTATLTPTPSAMCGPPVYNITSVSGIVGNSSVAQSSQWGNNGLISGAICGDNSFSSFYSGPFAVYFLNLGATIRIGGTLVITTCGVTSDNTVLYAGLGCPTSGASFQCLRGNDNVVDEGMECSSNPEASTIVLRSVSTRTFYIMVGGFLGRSFSSGLSWEYFLTTATPTVSLPPTPSSTVSLPPTPSSTVSISLSPPPSLSRTTTDTPSPSMTATVTASVSLPPYQSQTPTPTPMCGPPANNITTLSGLSGTAPAADLTVYGNVGMFTSGSCLRGFSTFLSAPRSVYFLNLGPSAMSGGRLTVTTCGETTSDTMCVCSKETHHN